MEKLLKQIHVNNWGNQGCLMEYCDVEITRASDFKQQCTTTSEVLPIFKTIYF